MAGSDKEKLIRRGAYVVSPENKRKKLDLLLSQRVVK